MRGFCAVTVLTFLRDSQHMTVLANARSSGKLAEIASLSVLRDWVAMSTGRDLGHSGVRMPLTAFYS